MNFSELIEYSGVAEFSTDSQYLAVAKGLSVIVFDTAQLTIESTFKVLDQVSKIVWSQDSSLILCPQYKRGVINVFNIKDTRWNAKIKLGASGLTGAYLSPDSRHVLSVNDFQLRLSIWSLLDKSVYHIKSPKFSERGLSFSRDGKYMALLEREEGKDYGGIYDLSDWSLVSRFEMQTENANDLVWTGDCTSIIVWDNPVSYLLLAYAPDGTLLTRYSANPGALGIQGLSLNGNSMAIHSFDNNIRVVNAVTWTELAKWKHEDTVRQTRDLYIYSEEEKVEGRELTSQYVLLEPTKTLQGIEKKGFTFCKWSGDGRFFASRSERYPTVLWIWDNLSMSLKSLIIQKRSVLSGDWCPAMNIFALVTDSKQLYIWSDDGASVCDLPFKTGEFNGRKVKWSPDGQALLIGGNRTLVVAYPRFQELQSR